uniref:Uncharacterized protein n=1 Tax=Anguilla anguilla TaxID=7936 RepID=A0A0E9R0X4_ANGAN
MYLFIYLFSTGKNYIFTLLW